MNIKIEIDFSSLTILFNELPMLSFKIEKFKGYQSWTDGNKFSIEFYFYNDESILSEYDNIEKFSSILRQLKDINIKNALL